MGTSELVSRDWNKDWELTKKATPGPWEARYLDDDDEMAMVTREILSRTEIVGYAVSEPKAVFIAEAREALPYWLQRVRELEERLAEVQEALRELAYSPVTLDDARLDYVEMQVYRTVLEYARELLRGDKDARA